MADAGYARLAFTTLDVFTSTPFTGNPLAVVWDADHLSDVQMQRVAAEFGYSETVFVCNAKARSAHACLRIFTPTFELGFAGHPTIGAAIAFAEKHHFPSGDVLVFEEAAGLVYVDFSEKDGFLKARLTPPVQPELIEPAAVIWSEALSFSGQAKISAASAGTPFAFLELETARLVDECETRAGFAAAMDTLGCVGLFVFAAQMNKTFYARMFAPEIGFAEDPATGSAVAALSAVLWDAGTVEGTYTIHQGVKMGRPSLIELGMKEASSGALGAVHIGGEAVMMMQGFIRG